MINELEVAEELTRDNDVLTLQFCVNYGGRAEIADAAARDRPRGRGRPARPGQGRREDASRGTSTSPDMPDVDLFVRSSGEQRTSNFLLWQSAYAEMVFLDTLWPDFDRRDLWRAIEIYASARPPLRRRAAATRCRALLRLQRLVLDRAEFTG